jgi:hypothetical protein
LICSKQRSAKSRGIAARHHAFDQLFLIVIDRAHVAERRHGAAQTIGLAGVKCAATMASFIACSWNSGTPEVFSSTSRSSSGQNAVGRAGILHRLLAVAAAQIGMHHAALDRSRPDDRHLDDQIVQFSAGFMRGSMLICARLSTWNTPMLSALQHVK